MQRLKLSVGQIKKEKEAFLFGKPLLFLGIYKIRG
jgi:hypothetical protein